MSKGKSVKKLIACKISGILEVSLLHSRLRRQWLLLIVAAALSAQDAKPQALIWPVPRGWGHETIPFPLDFAPELKHKGIEELRFMPGFFDPASPSWWSYAFVWGLDDDDPPSREALESELTLYFKGLCTQVGSKKGFKMDPDRFQCRIEDSSGRTVRAYQGQVTIFDAFKTGKALTLHLRIRTWWGLGHCFVAVAASPQTPQASVWTELDECLGKVTEPPQPLRSP